MRDGSFTILPVAGSRYVRVSVVVVRVSVDIGAEDEAEGDGVVEVTPGLLVDGLGVVVAGRSVVVDGRSGFAVDWAAAVPAKHSSAAPSMNLDLCMMELLWKVCRIELLPPVFP